MTSKLVDIKDMEPNQDTIRICEMLLEQAKSGELRSVMYICGWNDDAMSHGWAIDRRNSKRRLLSELVLLQHDHITNIEFMEKDSCLSRRFEDWGL